MLQNSAASPVALLIGSDSSPPIPSPVEGIDRLGVKPKKACQMLDIGNTRLYELLKNRELVSYKDGRNRKILVESIKNYVKRQVEKAA